MYFAGKTTVDTNALLSDMQTQAWAGALGQGISSVMQAGGAIWVGWLQRDAQEYAAKQALEGARFTNQEAKAGLDYAFGLKSKVLKIQSALAKTALKMQDVEDRKIFVSKLVSIQAGNDYKTAASTFDHPFYNYGTPVQQKKAS
ncbi:hypothetical protein KKA47_01465 [bacterium]|nr:hypothetical protein [bacterium]